MVIRERVYIGAHAFGVKVSSTLVAVNRNKVKYS